MFRKPDFICIGAPRTATTWLFEMLASNAEIGVPGHKALNYFNEYYNKGDKWYLNQFLSLHAKKVIGELSPLYFGQDLVPQRIASLLPNLKIILLVRDPIKRLESHINLINSMRGSERTMMEIIKSRPLLLEHGLYYKHLISYYKFFPKSNIFIISTKEIKNEPLKVLREIAKFLDVKNEFKSQKQNQKIGYTINPKSKFIEKIRIKVFRFLQNNGLSKYILLIKKTGLSDTLRKVNAGNQKMKLNADEIGYLKSVYSDDVLKFQQLTGLDIKEYDYK